MKDPIPSFIRSAKQCGLSKEEKALIASRLGIRVSERPLKRHLGMTSTVFLKKMKAISLSPSEKAITREWLMNAIQQRRHEHWWLHPLKHMTSLVAGILIVTITSGSLSFAAESAMPGDILYPLKVNVNETVQGALKKTPEDQAVWEATKAERRLKEAEMMNTKAVITDAQKAQIEERFRRHSLALRTHIANMPLTKGMEIGQQFEATLRAHGRALERMNSLHPHRAEHIQSLIAEVQDERMKVEEHLVSTMARVNENDGEHDIMIATAERQALRREIENQVLAHLPPSLENSVMIDSAPPSAMKAVPAMLQANIPENALYDADASDIAFSIEAKMRVTKRKLKELREDMNRPDLPAPSDIEIRMMGAEQILSVAKSQMENGNIDDALRASDMALRHAERARKEGERRMKSENEKIEETESEK